MGTIVDPGTAGAVAIDGRFRKAIKDCRNNRELNETLTRWRTSLNNAGCRTTRHFEDVVAERREQLDRMWTRAERESREGYVNAVVASGLNVDPAERDRYIREGKRAKRSVWDAYRFCEYGPCPRPGESRYDRAVRFARDCGEPDPEQWARDICAILDKPADITTGDFHERAIENARRSGHHKPGASAVNAMRFAQTGPGDPSTRYDRAVKWAKDHDEPYPHTWARDTCNLLKEKGW